MKSTNQETSIHHGWVYLLSKNGGCFFSSKKKPSITNDLIGFVKVVGTKKDPQKEWRNHLHERYSHTVAKNIECLEFGSGFFANNGLVFGYAVRVIELYDSSGLLLSVEKHEDIAKELGIVSEMASKLYLLSVQN